MLEQQAQQLTAKNEELDTFVYSVSHDLKAPLVTMQGMAGLLLEDYAAQLDDRGTRYLRRLQANVEQMERLITDLLAISRIGRDGRAGEAVNLVDVVDELMVEMTAAIEARGAKIIVRDAVALWGVRTHIQQVLGNLIGNAIKYAGDASPMVEISAVDRSEFVECSVRDNGVGIDPAYHAKIFEMFQRLQDVEAEGTGLGLAIVKKIVESAGGRVWVESAKGAGAIFRFTWPAMGAARTGPRPPSSAPARRAG
jgi:signal transduction histidine kinase